MLTVSGLLPSSTYNCSVISFSYSTPSEPAYIAISTVGTYATRRLPQTALRRPGRC